MIRMILADDEPVIIRGIHKLIEWRNLGIEIVGEYTDGKAALEGILREKPELALLDIQMPKKTGIDILKEIFALDLTTKVIFISGFEDFQYAKAAISYGAEDYLLKPVIREELIESVERCIFKLDKKSEDSPPENMDQETITAYETLIKMEEDSYLPVVAEILYTKEVNIHEEKLIRFSIMSNIEQYLKGRNLGIVFEKNNHLIVVLKEVEIRQAKELIWDLMKQVEDNTGNRIGLIISKKVDSMAEIPSAYLSCLDLAGYLFFESMMKVPILTLDQPVFMRTVTMEEFSECRSKMVEAMIIQNNEKWEKEYNYFLKLLCEVSDGKKEDACYHFCTTLRICEERFAAMRLPGLSLNMKEILETGRSTKNYRQMSAFFGEYILLYRSQIRSSVIKNDRKDINRAKAYIEEHYDENLTLEVLAGEIHMNPYYFSSFFKKGAGENFKDYLNKVRMKHAVSLLLSTDKRTYEIADEVGFRDARSFTELFQRIYGETPSSYRKRIGADC